MPELTQPKNFDTFPQPGWNTPDSVSLALESAANADSETASWSSYNQLLYALGNNHAGTYYPVALAALPSIERILCDGSPWAQHSVLNVLVDLHGSFEPEVGHEMYRGSSLSSQLKQGIFALVSLIETVAQNKSVASQSAQDLLELLHD